MQAGENPLGLKGIEESWHTQNCSRIKIGGSEALKPLHAGASCFT